MDILAIIMARGGSTRIPLKNITPFLGEPLMARIISSCREAGVFSRILVATDDERIAAVARRYGLEIPFLREFLVTNSMHTDPEGNPLQPRSELDRIYLERYAAYPHPLACYCLENLAALKDETFTGYALLPANAPFVSSGAILRAHHDFTTRHRDLTQSLVTCRKDPWFCFQGPLEHLSPLFPHIHEHRGQKLLLRTQDLPETFIFCPPTFARAACRTHEIRNRGLIIQPRETALEIDTPEDLAWCARLARGLDR